MILNYFTITQISMLVTKTQVAVKLIGLEHCIMIKTKYFFNELSTLHHTSPIRKLFVLNRNPTSKNSRAVHKIGSQTDILTPGDVYRRSKKWLRWTIPITPLPVLKLKSSRGTIKELTRIIWHHLVLINYINKDN